MCSPHQRWKFGIRTLLSLIAILSIWLAIRVNGVRRQKTAVTAVLQLGGQVTYDWEPSMLEQMVQVRPNPTFVDEPPGPKWLRQIIGDEYFQHVVGVRLSPKKPWAGGLDISESTLNHLASLRELEELLLTRTDISDEDLHYIGKLNDLRVLVIRDNEISDCGLFHLRSLRKLEQLNVINTEVTADGVATLQEALPQCAIVYREPPPFLPVTSDASGEP